MIKKRDDQLLASGHANRTYKLYEVHLLGLQCVQAVEDGGNESPPIKLDADPVCDRATEPRGQDNALLYSVHVSTRVHDREYVRKERGNGTRRTFFHSTEDLCCSQNNVLEG
jgi:hypothetical protein